MEELLQNYGIPYFISLLQCLTNECYFEKQRTNLQNEIFLKVISLNDTPFFDVSFRCFISFILKEIDYEAIQPIANN